MLVTFLSSLILNLAITMILLMNPLSLGVWILLMALLIAVISGIITSSWFGFIIFLIYIGGMLVMFAYFASIQPNQFISLIIPLSILLSFSLIMYVSAPKSQVLFSLDNNPSISSLFHFFNIPLMILAAIMLFLALIAVVKISMIFMGSLRSFIN